MRDAAPVLDAVGPLIALRLVVANEPAAERVHGILLRCQVRIDASTRACSSAEAEPLVSVFGPRSEWSRTMRSLLWAHTTVAVPAFEGRATVDVTLPCSTDYAVAAASYVLALESGDVPLSLLFSGTVFHETPEGVRAAPIPWSSEARFALPLRVYREAVAHHYGDAQPLALRRDVLERLLRYRRARGLPTWEGAIESLLEGRA